MKNKPGLLLLAGVVAITAVPSISSSIATPARQQFQLTEGQKEFIRQFDEAVGTKVLPLASLHSHQVLLGIHSFFYYSQQLSLDILKPFHRS